VASLTRLEKEKIAVADKMRAQLEIARNRTKEWMAETVSNALSKQQAQEAEENRLRLEIDRLHREADERRVHVSVADAEKIRDESARKAVELAVREAEATSLNAVSPFETFPEALQLDEDVVVPAVKAVAPSKKSAMKALKKMLPTEDVLLNEVGVREGFVMTDLERAGPEEKKLARRHRATAVTSPTVPSVAVVGDVVALQVDEGVPGWGEPVIAQGVDDPNNALNLAPAHRDNCLRICSGGDDTVYRDGTVSPLPAEQSTTHATGACMKLCAMFTIDVTGCDDPAHC